MTAATESLPRGSEAPRGAQRVAALLGALPRGQGCAARARRDRAARPDRDRRRPDRRLGHRPSEHAELPATMEDSFGLPKGPNSQFWFGADGEGRDLFVRTMYGARTSLIVGVVASLIAVLIGLVVGLIAGFFRGSIDTAVLARRRRDARDAAAPDLDRDHRGVQLEQERLRRRPDPARAAARDRRDRALLLAVHRPARARLHAVAPREGVRRGEPLARRRRTRGSSSARSCRTSPGRSSSTRRC